MSGQEHISEATASQSPVRLACRCYGARVEGGYRIEAEAFLCGRRHKQGDFISSAEERYARLVEDEWDRAEAEWLEQS